MRAGSCEGDLPDRFQALAYPAKFGNTGDIAFGGYALSVGVQAACQTVPSTHLLYSATGSFLGPLTTTKRPQCSVRRIRDTRTFATRQVEVFQEHVDGSMRMCMILLVDFHKKEAGSVLTYSAPPDMAEMARRGDIPVEMVADLEERFGLLSRHFDLRQTPEGISAQNLSGAVKHLPTTQDSLPVPSRTSADWFRCRDRVELWTDQCAGLAYIMDGFSASLPFAHSSANFGDTSACSSLDFALRLFTDEIDLNEWNLRELKTTSADVGRTYTEARLWNRSGKMVANMTQQCIMRPHAPAKAAL
ncbi:unnamed protein product [Parascedosporium putredinis]|uniref:Acyl-CoA thioesterase II n=1 Tax=Parascedosporium putredinis TaxID=1442378 RepID=A0A9P1H2Y9_9PEZI|nr:unnamed protein product [Parascedosporium putredinis]CAI7994053.1 unnamed protein product [Parascedosporium putredinis]